MQVERKKLIVTRHAYLHAGKHFHYRVAGSGSPLVLLHGYGVSGNLWQRTLPYLAQYHTVYCVDLPGHGRSSYAQPWRLREMAPLLASWLRQMQLPPVALMGQSMGGAIAIDLTAHAPELIEKLILVSSAGIPLQTELPHLVVRSMRSIIQPHNARFPLPLIIDVLQPRFRLLWQAAQEVIDSDFYAELATITIPTLIIWG